MKSGPATAAGSPSLAEHVGRYDHEGRPSSRRGKEAPSQICMVGGAGRANLRARIDLYALYKCPTRSSVNRQAMFANAVLVVDAASADEFRTTVLAQRFVVFRTSVLEGRATQHRLLA